MSTQEEHLQLISDCEARESKLSDWERNYIDSIKHQLESGDTLSITQAETLDTIWEKVTA